MVDIKHVATLAQLKIEDNELDKYQSQLNDIMTEIEKIVNVEVPNEDIMISSTTNKDRYEDDIIGNHISREVAYLRMLKIMIQNI